MKGNPRGKSSLQRSLSWLVLSLMLWAFNGCRSAPARPASIADAPVPPVRVEVPPAPAPPAAPSEDHKKSADGYVFEAVSVGRVAGIPLALVDIDGNLSVVVTGILLMTHRVEEIDVEHGRVILRRFDGPPLVLTVAESNSIQWPRWPKGEVNLTSEWVRQMNAFHMPSEMMMNWNQVSREGQIKILFSYLHQGMVVGVVSSGNDAGMGFTEKLFAKQIADEAVGKKQAFLASLAPGQRELYEAKMAPVRFQDPPEIKQPQIDANLALEARQKALVAGLTPEQRALYDEYQVWARH